MKKCCVCKIIKELIEFSKHKNRKDGHSTLCKECSKIRVKEWDLKNPGRHTERSSRWRKENPEAYKKIYKKSNAKWKANNLERSKEIYKIWKLNNPSKRPALESKRRAKKLQRTPKWLTKEHYNEIEEFYIKAKKLEKKTGIKHHVDHIIPLQGKNVSGLHVPWNLQILTAKENNKKYNKF